MEKYFIVGLVALILIVVVWYTQVSSGENKDPNTLKQTLQKAFPQYSVIEQNGTIMICEINHRNEPDELVFIRVDRNQEKNVRMFGRRATITYKKAPSVREIKKDVAAYLK